MTDQNKNFPCIWFQPPSRGVPRSCLRVDHEVPPVPSSIESGGEWFENIRNCDEILHLLLRSVLDIDADSRLCDQRLELLCQVPIPGLAALKTPCHAFVRQCDDHPLLASYPQDARRRPSWLILRPSRRARTASAMALGGFRCARKPRSRGSPPAQPHATVQRASRLGLGASASDEFAQRMFAAIDNRRRRQAQGISNAKAAGSYRGRPENTGRNAGIGHMLADGCFVDSGSTCHRMLARYHRQSRPPRLNTFHPDCCRLRRVRQGARAR